MRCIACNAEINLTYRTIEIEEDTFITIEEDMCPKCIEAARGFDTEEYKLLDKVNEDGNISTEDS